VQAIPDLVDARAATRARTAATADLLDGARAIVDDRFERSIAGGVTEADQHRESLIMLFKSTFVKRRFRAR